jgi:rod shape-determining protein MreC
MGRVFIFIRHFYVYLLFVVLQVVALVMLYNYSRVHKAVFSQNANQITGAINSKFYKTQDYLHLTEVNENLAKQNALLLQQQPFNFSSIQNKFKDFSDTLFYDTTGKAVVRVKYRWIEAKVVYNSLFKEKNYIQLDKGTKDNLRVGMGILSDAGGVAGKIVEISNGYATAMSLLHKDFFIQCRLKQANITGQIKWDGEDYRFVNVEKISKDILVNKGDSLLTIGSNIFPDNMPIAIVDTAYAEKGSGYLKIKAHTVTNFGALSFAYIIENRDTEELKKQLLNAEAK